MPFRADEAAAEGHARAIRYLIHRLPPALRQRSQSRLERIIAQYGPVVDGYPTWHPLVWSLKHDRTSPSEDHGYRHLDHVILLRSAFIACPYGHSADLITSALNRDPGPMANIDAEEIDVPLYAEEAEPVLVSCEWDGVSAPADGTAPKRAAVGRLLTRELAKWSNAEVGETWSTMQPYFLGSPHGARSSAFVNEATGMAMKRVWASINEAEVFGELFDR